MENIVSVIEKNLQDNIYGKIHYLKDGKEDLSIPYVTVIRDAKRLATFLKKNFVHQSRIVLVFPQGIDFITALIGCFYAGMIGVPTYPLQNAKHSYRLKKIINSCKPSLILGSHKTINDLSDMSDFKEFFMISSEKVLQQQENIDFDLMEIPSFEDLAFLQYTSGSTGSPKGVMVSHSNLAHNLSTLKNDIHFSKDKKIVSWLPFQHDLGLMTGPLSSLYNGNEFIILPPVSVIQNPYLWLKALSDYGAYFTSGPNFAYQLCVDKISDELLDTLDLSTLDYACAAAEPNRINTATSFFKKFSRCGFKKEAYCVGYGLAEATVHVTTNTYGRISSQKEVSFDGLSQSIITAPLNQKDTQILMSAGTLCSEHHVVIVNPDTRTPSKPNEVGEIWVCSQSIAQGYWDNEKTTQETFKATIEGESNHYLRTGDLGFIDGNQLYVTGRLKDLIIINGRNIYPQDVELIIEGCHEEIKSHGVAVFSAELNNQESVVVCAEVKRSAVKKDNSEMIIAIRHAVAENFEIDIADIKLIYPGHSYHTTSGKIQRSATKEAYLNHDLVCLKTTEGTPTSELTNSHHKKELMDILCSVLDVHDIKEHQHFMDLGGTSLHAKMLHQQLEMRFGKQCKIPPTIAFEYPTLSALVAFFAQVEE